MAIRNSNSDSTIRKWIKEGRGAGRGKDYKPWLTVRDVSSVGRSHRIFGHKSRRTHHLLSDLELAIFLLLEWNSDTEDIREQFPLRLEDTEAIAFETGIAHPAYRGQHQIMTSDFLVNTRNVKEPKFALQAKYSESLQDTRTIEKLELERRYWNRKSVPWKLVTEKDIPSVVFQNIKWLYPAQRDELDANSAQERAAFYAHYFKRHPKYSLIEIAKQMDVAYSLPIGQSLLEIRQLLANRYFVFSIFKPYGSLMAGELILAIANSIVLEGVLHVSNQ
jgi:hypothetical protein